MESSFHDWLPIFAWNDQHERISGGYLERLAREFVKLFARDCSSEEDAHGSGVLSGTIETMPSFT